MKDYNKLKEIANKLNGLDWRDATFDKTLENERKLCEENGIVICYGYSDDLIEFDGAFRNEFDVWEGGTIHINEEGKKASGKKYHSIGLLFCKNKITWQYKFKARHESFDLIHSDDNSIFCRGIVFFKEDLKKEYVCQSNLTFNDLCKDLNYNFVKWNDKVVYDGINTDAWLDRYETFKDDYKDKKINQMKLKVVHHNNIYLDIEGEE